MADNSKLHVLVEFSDKSLAVIAYKELADYSAERDPVEGSECIAYWKKAGAKKKTKHPAVILSIGGKWHAILCTWCPPGSPIPDD